MPSQVNGLYEFGLFRLDAAKRLLSRSGESVMLAPKTFDVLLMLVEGDGRVLTKRELMSSLWPDTFVEEASLSYQIAALRKVLGDEGEKWIETVPKHGYRFAATVIRIGGDQTDRGDQSGTTPPKTSRLQLRAIVPWGLAGLATIVAITSILVDRTPPPGQLVRFPISPRSSDESFGFLAVSPDGESIAFIASSVGRGGGQLLVRHLTETTPRVLTAAPMPGRPFWSPDSRSIAFFTGAQLMRIDAKGGTPQVVCDAPGPYADGDWGPNGEILFHTGLRRALYRVAATGGQPKQLLPLDPARQETSHRAPQFLPDGRHFIFFIQSGRTENRGIYIGSLDSKESKLLINTDRNATYAGSRSGYGHLLYLQGTTLVAQRFDDKHLRLRGEPEPLAEGIAAIRLADVAPAVFGASSNGVIAYRRGKSGLIGELAWFDRQGRRLSTVGEPAEYNTLGLSPDETKLAVAKMNPQTATNDLWMFNLKDGTSSRFTFSPADELNPVWSPDGAQVVFCSTQRGSYDIYQKAASGIGDAQLLLESDEYKFPHFWTHDGRFLFYSTAGAWWALPMAGNHEKYDLPAGSQSLELSPDGKWLAYKMAESSELYVQGVRPSGGKWQVSKAEGDEPHWRPDGKELFFVAGNTLMAVDVQTDTQVFHAGTPKPLFEFRPMPSGGTRYQVADNGRRFLVNTPLESTQPEPITVVTNWTAGLKR
jgi:eukaryotic-like serine/threonine-protein kinase